MEIQGKNKELARALKSSIPLKMEKLEVEESRDSGLALADLAFNLSSAHLKREEDLQSAASMIINKQRVINRYEVHLVSKKNVQIDSIVRTQNSN